MRLLLQLWFWSTAGKVVLSLDRLAGRARRWYDKRSPLQMFPLTVHGDGVGWPVTRKRVNVKIRNTGSAPFVWAGSISDGYIPEDELIHTCGDCGATLQIVRPGKYQCPKCS